MHIPVPWVFILMYLAGAAIESVRPPFTRAMLPGTGIAGALPLAVGAVIAGWGQVLFRLPLSSIVGAKLASVVHCREGFERSADGL